METIIKIKKNKPAFKALILLAKELEKNDRTSISVSEQYNKKQKSDAMILPCRTNDPTIFFDQLEDFPDIDQLRKEAWPKIS